MIVGFELLGTDYLENVISMLNYRFDKVVYFGYPKMIEEKEKVLDSFLKSVCEVKEVEFVPIIEDAVTDTIFVMQNELERESAKGNDLFFDVTGGEDLLLVACGILAERTRVAFHYYDVENNRIIEFENEGRKMLSESAVYNPIKLDVEEYISLYGGKINETLHKEYKSTAQSKEERKTIDAIWEVYARNISKWNLFCDFLKKYVNAGNDLSVNFKVSTLSNRGNEYKKAVSDMVWISEVIEEFEKSGVIVENKSDRNILRFRFINEFAKEYIWESGSILEMHTFLEMKEESDNCRVGVHIDWDGEIHDKSFMDVTNEIDVISIKNNIMTFISCKSGNLDKSALYELDAVASRFGGKYVKKVIVAPKGIGATDGARATEMNIEIR